MSGHVIHPLGVWFACQVVLVCSRTAAFLKCLIVGVDDEQKILHALFSWFADAPWSCCQKPCRLHGSVQGSYARHEGRQEMAAVGSRLGKWIAQTDDCKQDGRRVPPFATTVSVVSKKRRYQQLCKGIFWPIEVYRKWFPLEEPEAHTLTSQPSLDDSDEEEEGVILPEIVGQRIAPGCRRLMSESGREFTSSKTIADSNTMSAEHCEDVRKAASQRFSAGRKAMAPTMEMNDDDEHVPVVAAEDHEASKAALAKNLADSILQCFTV